MVCEKFLAYLRECVELHRIPDVDPFEAHLESCPACQQEWTHWQVLDRAISEWNDLGETPDLSSRVLSELTHGTPQHRTVPSARPRRRALTRWIMAATVTALLLAFVPLVLSFLMREHEPSRAMVKNGPETDNLAPVRTTTNVKEISWEELVGKTRTAYSSLLDEAGIHPQALSTTIMEQHPNPVPRDHGSHEPTSLGLLSRDVRESVGFLGRLLPPLEPNR
jgi:hypothetical protein